MGRGGFGAGSTPLAGVYGGSGFRMAVSDLVRDLVSMSEDGVLY